MDRSRPSLFVGSSKKGMDVAKALQVLLDQACEVTIWSQGVFDLSQGTLESLANSLADFDFAALILTPDDLVTSCEVSYSSPRDNVLFELGLFMGDLGRDRTYIIYDRSANLKLPSDLAGVTAATYEPHLSGNLLSALGAATTLIEGAIGRLGRRSGRATNDKSNASLLRSRADARILDGHPIEYFRDIFIAGPTLAIVAMKHRFFQQVIERGCHVKFLIPDPDRNSPAMLGLLAHWHTTKDGFIGEVKSALENFNLFKQRINHDAQGTFEIKYLDCAPTLSLVMVNGNSRDGQIHVELLPFATASPDRPHFVLDARDVDNSWYAFFRERCERMWESGHLLDIDSFSSAKMKHLQGEAKR